MAKTAAWVALAYLSIGWSVGAVMHFLIPAMNWLGLLYYTLTWPAYPICHFAGCDPMPPHWVADHLFTFMEAPNG